MARWSKRELPARSTRARKRQAAKVKPTDVASCVDCRLHAARLPEEWRARYAPPLGQMFTIRANGGTRVRVCPRCTKLPWVEGEGRNRKTVSASLVDRGYTSQASVDRARLRFTL